MKKQVSDIQFGKDLEVQRLLFKKLGEQMRN